MEGIIRALAPFGVVGLAIFFTYLSARKGATVWLWVISIVAIIGLVAMEKFIPTPGLYPIQNEGQKKDLTVPPPPTPSTSGGAISHVWVDTGLTADWNGRDYAYSSGYIPKYVVANNNLCNLNRIGYVAVCWDQRPNGYPVGISISDVSVYSSPPQWCTYKNSEVKLSTTPDGHAPRGRVYLCAVPVN